MLIMDKELWSLESATVSCRELAIWLSMTSFEFERSGANDCPLVSKMAASSLSATLPSIVLPVRGRSSPNTTMSWSTVGVKTGVKSTKARKDRFSVSLCGNHANSEPEQC